MMTLSLGDLKCQGIAAINDVLLDLGHGQLDTLRLIFDSAVSRIVINKAR